MGLFLPGVHRAAHDPERVETAQIGDGFALVEFDRLPADPVRGQEIAEDAGVFDGDVLQDEDAGSVRQRRLRILRMGARHG